MEGLNFTMRLLSKVIDDLELVDLPLFFFFFFLGGGGGGGEVLLIGAGACRTSRWLVWIVFCVLGPVRSFRPNDSIKAPETSIGSFPHPT